MGSAWRGEAEVQQLLNQLSSFDEREKGRSMMPHAKKSPQRSAAIAFGLVYLPTFILLVIANFGILQPLINGAQPAQNILAHATLFRIGALGFLLYGLSVMVQSALLYILLQPVGQNLALLALLGRLVNGIVWLMVALNLFTALRLLSRPEYGGLAPHSLQSLAELYLSGFDQYYIGLLCWSLSAAVGAYLWLKSGHVPRVLAVFGILVSTWCVGCTLVLFILPNIQEIVNLWLFDTPMVLFEISLSILLLIRGLRGMGFTPTQLQTCREMVK